MNEAERVYAIYSPSLQCAKRVRDLLTSGTSAAKVFSARSWPEFERFSAAASCGIVCLEWLQGQELTALQAYRRRCPLQPTVLITEHTRENSRRLRDIPLNEVVWTSEMAALLKPAVTRASSSRLLYLLASGIPRNASLPILLREGLTIVFKSHRPIRSLKELVQLLGCARSTLRRQWLEAFGHQGSLKELLDWVIILRAVERKSPSRSWSSIAEELGVDRDTLSQISMRLMNRRLSTIGPGDFQDIMDRFFGDYGHRLLESKFTDSSGRP